MTTLGVVSFPNIVLDQLGKILSDDCFFSAKSSVNDRISYLNYQDVFSQNSLFTSLTKEICILALFSVRCSKYVLLNEHRISHIMDVLQLIR